MARPRNLDKPVQWKVSIPTSIANMVKKKLHDPIFNEIPLGARSKLIEMLLRRWLMEQKEN